MISVLGNKIVAKVLGSSHNRKALDSIPHDWDTDLYSFVFAIVTTVQIKKKKQKWLIIHSDVAKQNG